MADDPNPDNKPDPKDDKPDPDAGAKKALEVERKARRDADVKVKDLEQKLAKIEGDGKSKGDQLTEQVAKLTEDLADERVKRIRAEVAAEHQLSPFAAKRLTGTTQDEMEADAKEWADNGHTVSAAKGDAEDDTKRPPSRRPAPALRGGGDPTEEPVETNPSKLAESVPRL